MKQTEFKSNRLSVIKVYAICKSHPISADCKKTITHCHSSDGCGMGILFVSCLRRCIFEMYRIRNCNSDEFLHDFFVLGRLENVWSKFLRENVYPILCDKLLLSLFNDMRYRRQRYPKWIWHFLPKILGNLSWSRKLSCIEIFLFMLGFCFVFIYQRIHQT